MASIDVFSPTILDRAATPLGRVKRLSSSRDIASEDWQDACARRRFVQDMLERSPDAFAGDLDVQAMMQHNPGSF